MRAATTRKRAQLYDWFGFDYGPSSISIADVRRNALTANAPVSVRPEAVSGSECSKAVVHSANSQARSRAGFLADCRRNAKWDIR